MTRAQALLIIVGDADVLGLDPLWRRFLNYIHESGGWKGRRIPWDPTEGEQDGVGYDARRRGEAERELDDLIERTRAMIIDDGRLAERAEDQADVRRMEAGAEQPWREDQ